MQIKKIKIGTRGSPLALRQTTLVIEALADFYPEIEIETVIIKTTGDKVQDVPLAALGGKGLFIKEIEEALLDRRIDLAVHSLKDMPGELPKGLILGAIPFREDPRDILISRDRILLKDIPGQKKIGTGSLRRKVQVLGLRPDLQIVPIRGNLETRLKKMESEDLAGIILAAAGIHRMGFKDRISQYLDVDIFLPAVGQGALALEICEADSRLQELVKPLHHEATALCTQAERAFLNRLQGGCQIPIAGHARIQGERIILKGLIAGLDDGKVLRDQLEGSLSDPVGLGIRMAEKLLKAGGQKILDEIVEKKT